MQQVRMVIQGHFEFELLSPLTQEVGDDYLFWKTKGDANMPVQVRMSTRFPDRNLHVDWPNPSLQPPSGIGAPQSLQSLRGRSSERPSVAHPVLPLPTSPWYDPPPRPRRNSFQTPISMSQSQTSRTEPVERTDNRHPSRPRQASVERTGRVEQALPPRLHSMEREKYREHSRARRGQSAERTGSNGSRGASGSGDSNESRSNESRGRQVHRAPPHGDPESRAFLKSIADSTIAAINSGLSDVSSTQKNTVLFDEDAPQLAAWQSRVRRNNGAQVEINILPFTTLQAARDFSERNKHKRIGVLNFASATSPGGGFLSGAQAQEESIARSSTLYVSLVTRAARPFYSVHARDKKGGFYTHAMIYSPAIHLLRMDDGEWLRSQIKVDVLTCAAVNAGEVRKTYNHHRPEDVERWICETMGERMARILTLFERKGARQLVLGSFGTGVFKNDVQAMAKIWGELLYAPNAPFSRSFDHVVFAIPDQETRRKFAIGFNSPESVQE